jgi:hypothetical protein
VPESGRAGRYAQEARVVVDVQEVGRERRVGLVIYEVYPRSFADADGDGVGDLPGLRSRLGYLADLGPAPVPLPAHRDVLLASGPVPGGSLPPGTAASLCT